MTLDEFTRDPISKKRIRGSISRVAEHLRLSRSTVQRIISGERIPGVDTQRKIQDMIHARKVRLMALSRNQWMPRKKD